METKLGLVPKPIIANQLSVPGSTKGFIYRRIDTQKGNDISFDFRNVKFRRWAIDVTAIFDSETIYNSHSLVNDGNGNLFVCVKNGIIGQSLNNQNYWIQLPYTNGSYISPQPGGFNVSNIYFPVEDTTNYEDYNMWMNPDDYESSYLNTIKFGNTSDSDIIHYNNNVISGGNFYSNNISDYFFENNIGVGFNTNKINSYFSNNLILVNFNRNNIEAGFGNNLVEQNCYENNIGLEFNGNIIAQEFSYNNLKNSTSSNIFRNNFTYNNLESNNYSNVYGNNVFNNKFDFNFSNNIIGNDFQFNRFNGEISGVDFSGFTSNVGVLTGEYVKEITTTQTGNFVVKYTDQYGDIIVLGIDDFQTSQPIS